MRSLWLGLLLLSSVSCTHTIDFRTSHFASPVVGDEQWSGHLAAVGSGVTKITVVNDIETNPPTRSALEVNKDVNVADLIGASNVSADFSLNVWREFDIFLDGSLAGIRYQFLNHGKQDRVWVGALHGAFAQRTTSTSSTKSGIESKAESKVTTSQAGISLGYKFAAVVPYFSYILESHEVSTNVTNGGGKFGPFEDKGTHYNYSIGLSSHHRGISYAIEYNMIEISWDRAERAYQNSAGAKIGFAW